VALRGIPAAMRTRRVDCSGPGIARRGHGRGFRYVRPNGRAVADAQTLRRIEELAIPPAWDDVWICPDPRGHIQATGTDDAGRKQYRYHDAWRTRRDAAKFDDMLDFAHALPRLRRRVARDLRRGEMDRRRASACAVRLLDIGFFRIGSERYAHDNHSYGLTTLHRRHVRVDGREVVFDYPAKSGQRRVQAVADPAAVKVVCELKRRRGGGDELLAYKQDRRWVDLDADDVNAYIKEAAGGDFSAKDFRTFSATALCALSLAKHDPEAMSKSARERAVRGAIGEVAEYLGNTPAVARRAYIDPRVLDCFRAGITLDVAGARGPTSDRVRTALIGLLAD
jgi:DNA topoisomerase I